MDFKIEQQEFTVVFVGEFTPAQYQPGWFYEWNLISETEAKEATIEIINPHLTQLSFTWVSIKVTRERLIFGIVGKSFFEEFKDLITGFLGLKFSENIKALGLNHNIVLKTSEKNINKVFSHYTIKKLEDNLVKPSVISIGIEDKFPDDSPIRHVKYNLIKSNSKILLIKINNHLQRVNKDELMSLEYVEKILEEKWDEGFDRVDSFIKKL